MKKVIAIVILIAILIYGTFWFLNKNKSNVQNPTENSKSGNSITWDYALNLIADCKVTQVSQTHGLEVSLQLRNGDINETTEPAIDDIIKAARKSEAKCGSITISTE